MDKYKVVKIINRRGETIYVVLDNYGNEAYGSADEDKADRKAKELNR